MDVSTDRKRPLLVMLVMIVMLVLVLVMVVVVVFVGGGRCRLVQRYQCTRLFTIGGAVVTTQHGFGFALVVSLSHLVCYDVCDVMWDVCDVCDVLWSDMNMRVASLKEKRFDSLWLDLTCLDLSRPNQSTPPYSVLVAYRSNYNHSRDTRLPFLSCPSL
jgi:hypothetical protein